MTEAPGALLLRSIRGSPGAMPMSACRGHGRGHGDIRRFWVVFPLSTPQYSHATCHQTCHLHGKHSQESAPAKPPGQLPDAESFSLGALGCHVKAPPFTTDPEPSITDTYVHVKSPP
jgi:hypothetical protein